MITLKYPIKFGGKIFPKGTEVKRADLEIVKKEFPNIEKEENNYLFAIQGLTPDRKFHMVLKRQLEFTD